MSQPKIVSPAVAALAVVVSTILISTGGLIVRSLDTTDPDAINLVRSIALVVAVQVVGHLGFRRSALHDAIALGWKGLVGGLILGFAGITYLLALLNTSVAATTLTMSATPLLAGILAFAILGERIGRLTFMAAIVAAIGIAVMAMPQLEQAGTRFGFTMAVVTAMCFALFAVYLRQNKTLEVFPILIWAGLLIALFSAFRLGAFPVLSAKDWFLLILWGGAISAASNWLMMLASRSLQAAEFTLIGLLEYILAPFWVWVIVAEVPSDLVIFGGLLTFAAVVASLYEAWRKGRAR